MIYLVIASVLLFIIVVAAVLAGRKSTANYKATMAEVNECVAEAVPKARRHFERKYKRPPTETNEMATLLEFPAQGVK